MILNLVKLWARSYSFPERAMGNYLSKGRRLSAWFVGAFVFALHASSTVALADGDDFSNNLFSDLAPILTLFGEQVGCPGLRDNRWLTIVSRLPNSLSPVQQAGKIVSYLPWWVSTVTNEQLSRLDSPHS